MHFCTSLLFIPIYICIIIDHFYSIKINLIVFVFENKLVSNRRNYSHELYRFLQRLTMYYITEAMYKWFNEILSDFQITPKHFKTMTETSYLRYLFENNASSYYSSNWMNFRGDALHTGLSHHNGPIGNGTSFILSLLGAVKSSAVVDTMGNIYFGTISEQFYKVSSTGSYFWIYYATGGFYSSPVINYEEDVIYCATERGYIYALSTSTGTEIWSSRVQYKSITSSPYIYGKGNNATLIIAETYGLIYGENLTTTPIFTLIDFAPFDYSSPVVFGDMVYVGAAYYYILNCSLSLRYCDYFFEIMDGIR